MYSPKSIEVVKIRYKNCEHFAQTVCKVQSIFGINHAGSRTAIVRLIAIFEHKPQFTDEKMQIHQSSSRSVENNNPVAEGLSIPSN